VRSGTNWVHQAYLRPFRGDAYDGFGSSVAISGTNVVIGASYDSNGAKESGGAYVFVRTNATKWTQRAYLKAANLDENDHFGRSAAISGDTVVVGADGESSIAPGVNGDPSDNSAPNAGEAYVFVRDELTWLLVWLVLARGLSLHAMAAAT